MNHDEGNRFSGIIFDEASHITDEECEQLHQKLRKPHFWLQWYKKLKDFLKCPLA